MPRTFKTPPRGDGTLSIAQLLDWHGEHNPEWIFARYWQSSIQTYKELTWSQILESIHASARYYARHFNIDVDQGHFSPVSKLDSKSFTRPTIGILANVEPLSYFIQFWSLMRIGLVPFALSNNNSKEAIVHLVKASGISAILVGPPGTSAALESNVQAALSELKQSSDQRNIQTMSWPDSVTLQRPEYQKKIFTFPKVDSGYRMSAVHSSGSTSFPKPIFSTFDDVDWFTHMTYQPVDDVDFDVNGKSVLLSSLPPFHAFSLYWGAFAVMGAGTTILIREPVSPPAPINPPSILADVNSLKPDIFLSVPSLYKAWSQNSSAIEALKSTRICVSGGGPLDANAAITLRSSGVPLINMLASSECGVVTLFPDLSSEIPFQMRFSTIPKIILRPQDTEPDVFELIIARNGSYRPLVFNDIVDDEPVYATSDLVKVLPLANPGDPQYFTVVGRKDDQIMHSTGEKTNPGPLIAIIERHPAIRSCCFFGRGKPHPGLLCEPSEEFTFADGNDDAALATYRNTIWSAIEEANQYAPSHSRLYKEMIIVGTSKKPLPMTPKGTIRVGVAIKYYDDEIQETYRRFDEIGVSTVAAPKEWNSESTREYVRLTIKQTLSHLESITEQDDDKDIFSWGGADSLSATKIRNLLNSALSTGIRLEPNFVYANPTIAALSDALLSAQKQSGAGGTDETQIIKQRVEACEAMYQKYITGVAEPSRFEKNNVHRSTEKVVLLTGTTGGLGSHLLYDLLQDTSISQVYAINRPSSGKQTLLQRQQDAFTSRGLDAGVLDGATKVLLIEGDLTAPNFGLDARLYEEISSKTTMIIHNAWTLNFNLSLSSFEPLIHGTRCLIDLALASDLKPGIIFTSSIATVSNYRGSESKVPEKFFNSFQTAIGTGYSESKSVVEKLLYQVSQQTGLCTATIRIGQMSGSTTNGSWATTDWFPLIVKSAETLHCLPDFDFDGNTSLVSWIATDVASQVLLDFCDHLKTSQGDHKVFHLVHPKETKWHLLIKGVVERLNSTSNGSKQVQLVPYSDWLNQLKSISNTHTLEQCPTLKLLDFFKHAPVQSDDGQSEAMGIKRLDTAQSQQISTRLQNAQPLDAPSAQQWVQYWRSVGFLKA
ncbi:unnamed protein product [Sympodiomycopsis kandeliae]